jgi:hypothetical protein
MSRVVNQVDSIASETLLPFPASWPPLRGGQEAGKERVRVVSKPTFFTIRTRRMGSANAKSRNFKTDASG